MSALSYMQRRASGTYEFRKRLPETLAGKAVPPHMREPFSELVNPATGCFKRELVRSLGTKEPKEAKNKNLREARRAVLLFDSATRAMTITATTDDRAETPVTADNRVMEEEALADLLATDEAERTDGDDRRRLQTPEDRAQWPDLVEVIAPSLAGGQAALAKGMAADHHLALGDHIEELRSEYRRALACRDPAIVRAETRSWLKRKGAIIREDGPDFHAAGLAILRAHVRAYDLMAKRQAGDIVETPIVATAAAPAGRGPKLSGALNAWKAGSASRNAKRPAPRTIVEAEYAVRAFQDIHGNLPLGDITRGHARSFREAMARVPKALPHALRKLPLRELLQRDDLAGLPPRSATTVNKLLNLIGGVIARAERDGHLDNVVGFSNPFTKMQLEKHEGEADREPFNRSDLTALFATAIYAKGERPRGGSGEACFWFPLIALLSGMRLNEIAQLRVCDLRHDEGTNRWLFDVGRTGGRSTKNTGSIRRVPVHPELVRMGLLRYRESLGGDPDGTAPLWPSVSAVSWSKWFNRYLRDVAGITSRAKVFHSFRHTFKRMARDAELQEEMHDALTGHAGHGGVGRHYGSGYSLVPLVAAMDKIVAPISLASLSWSHSGA